jgi:hypothetical protein
VYLLDTDHLGILQHETRPEFGRLTARIAEFEPSEFFVSSDFLETAQAIPLSPCTSHSVAVSNLQCYIALE